MRRKRRSVSQIKEDLSVQLLRRNIPEAWVLHEYRPDYGIDFVIELFDYIDETKTMAETLGESIFVQLKSSSSIDYTVLRVHPRGNVEKGPLQENTSEYYDLPVAKFVMDTADLLTVQAIGPAIPVLLVLVDLYKEKLYFLCLTDYIDKVLIPEDPLFWNKSAKTLYVPLANELCLDQEALVPLRAYGKRSKMYGAFGKFSYQKKEIDSAFGSSNDPIQIVNMIQTFVDVALRQAIWESHDFWKPVSWTKAELKTVKALIETGVSSGDLPRFLEHCWVVWYRLDNLSAMYEELVREWFLPTFLAQLTSYPTSEEPTKTPIEQTHQITE